MSDQVDISNVDLNEVSEVAEQGGMTDAQTFLLRAVKTPLGEEYVFKYLFGEGEKLVSQMRTALSRVRKQMLKDKRGYQSFKLYATVKSISEGEEPYDLITLKRSQSEKNKITDSVMPLVQAMELQNDGN